MSLIYTTPDPGDWYSWRKKDANKDLNPEEAKRKFLKEQLESQFELATLLRKLERIGNDGHGLWNFNKEFEN